MLASSLATDLLSCRNWLAHLKTESISLDILLVVFTAYQAVPEYVVVYQSPLVVCN